MLIYKLQIEELNGVFIRPFVPEIIDFLKENVSHLKKQNLDKISSTHIFPIVMNAVGFGFRTIGEIKALTFLVYSYSSPDRYEEDGIFINELNKNKISPIYRIDNIYQTLKKLNLKSEGTIL